MRLSIIACLFLTLPVSAQNLLSLQQDMAEGVCPYDTTQAGLYPQTYEVFLTQDDTYTGTIDSSWCPTFSFDAVNNNYNLLLTDFDFSRPLFVRLRYPENAQPVIGKYLDHSVSYPLLQNNWTFREGDCGDCSQIHFRYGAIDTLSGDTISRYFQYDYREDFVEDSEANCFMSEHFSDQFVTESGLTLWMRPNGFPRPQVLLGGFWLFPQDSPFRTREEVALILFPLSSFNGNEYEAYPNEVVTGLPRQGSAGEEFHLGQFTDRIPSDGNIRYTDVSIEGNPDTVVRARLKMTFFNEITFPPFTALRGSLVAGQQDLRHELTVAYEDNTISSCKELSVDRPVAPNTTYEFGTDAIAFGEDGACFVLEPQAAIAIRSDRSFRYGQNGQGLLAAKANTKLDLASRATLIMDNTLRLLHPDFLPEGGLHIYLAEGSKLIFGNFASVERKFPGSDSWVYVHNQGGSIDFGPLTPAERALFRFVEEEPITRQPIRTQVALWPNPVMAGRELHFVLPDSDPSVQKSYQLRSPTGSIILRQTVAHAPATTTSVPLPESLSPGIYLLQINSDGKNYLKRFIVR